MLYLKGEWSSQDALEIVNDYFGKNPHMNYVWNDDLDCYVCDDSERKKQLRKMWLEKIQTGFPPLSLNYERIGDWIKCNPKCFVHLFSGCLIDDEEIFWERTNPVQET